MIFFFKYSLLFIVVIPGFFTFCFWSFYFLGCYCFGQLSSFPFTLCFFPLKKLSFFSSLPVYLSSFLLKISVKPTFIWIFKKRILFSPEGLTEALLVLCLPHLENTKARRKIFWELSVSILPGHTQQGVHHFAWKLTRWVICAPVRPN